jgi:cytochrome c553
MFRAITFFTLLLTVSLLLPTEGFAQDVDAKGQRLFQTCAACHDVNGQGNAALQTPAIAGLTADYLSRQIAHFQKQTRGAKNDPYVMQMQASSQLLRTEQDIEVLTLYLASLAVPQLDIPVEGNVKRGKNLYNGNCGACHGASGEGNISLHAPRLANQSADYLLRQIKAFQAGHRGVQHEDKYGRQMAMMAATINAEQDLPDILSYLQAKNMAP